MKAQEVMVIDTEKNRMKYVKNEINKGGKEREGTNENNYKSLEHKRATPRRVK